jgi:ubiquinone/menaquinone biosynthesis C-methylase UbiE
MRWIRFVAFALLALAAVLEVLGLAQMVLPRLLPPERAPLVVPGALVALAAGLLLLLVEARRQRQAERGRLGGPGQITAVIGGRVRTRGIPYQLPHDVEEMNRLDFQHYMLRAVLGGNYLAPIGSPTSILDVGTGTGRWAREMAMMFPRANVIGLDVNTPAVDAASEARGAELRPPNYAFVAGNVLEGLPFGDASFDYVHMRALIAAIPHDRWPFVMGELLRVTRLGGWVESQEISLLQRGGPAVDQVMAWLAETIARKNVVFADGARVGEFLRATGLARVTVREVPVPCGDYGGRIGKMLAADWFNLLGSFRGLMVAQGIASAEQIDATLAAARAALAERGARAVMTIYAASAQRVR